MARETDAGQRREVGRAAADYGGCGLDALDPGEGFAATPAAGRETVSGIEASASTRWSKSTRSAFTEDVPMSRPRNVSFACPAIAASLEEATINKKPRPCRRG